MKQSLCLCLMILFVITISFHAYSAPPRVALVIGNNAYKDSPLKNPVNDARLVAETLQKLDFEVMEYTDIDQKSMKRAIQDFGDKLDEVGREAVGLFYYAGHGIQVNGENYLIPVNAAIERERDVDIEAVNANHILRVLDYARTRINFVIMDACRNNPFARSFRSAVRGLARMDAPRGTLIAYATAPGDVARDGDGANSPYSQALAEAMQQSDLQVEQMFKIVRRRVMADTQNSQVPWEASSLTGDFYFSQTRSEKAQAPKLPVSLAAIDKETLFWQSIKGSESAEDFEEYQRQFPDGVFAGLAENKLRALKGDTEPQAPEPEAQAQELVKEPEPVGKEMVAKKADIIPGGKSLSATVSPPQVAVRSVRTKEHEPNNSIGTANHTQATAVIGGSINPKGDVDWYHLAVRQQGALGITISNVAAEQDLVFRVWNHEYSAISGLIAPLRKGGETTGVVDLAGPGNYFVEVRDSHNDVGSSQQYSLNQVFTPTKDAYEPNNSFGFAATVTPGTSWRSTILPKGDSDWYRISVDRHGELTVLITEVPKNLDLGIRVWNGDKGAISGWIPPLKAGGDTEAVVDLPGPGLYVIEVRDGHNDNRSAQPFLTTLTYKPSVDRFGNNNSFGRSTPLAISETVQATILPKGDSDWYRLGVDEQGELKVLFNNVPAKMEINFRVWNEDKGAMTGWFGPLKPGGDTEAVIDLPTAGSYILEVRDSHNDVRSIDPYSLRATYTPTNDRGEPNNSFGSAVPLKLGAVVSGTILPKGDADWYRISTNRPGSLTVHITDSPADLEMSARIFNNEKKAISGWLVPLRTGGETKGEVAIPAAGNYYIEVRDGHNDKRSVTPYKLSATMGN